MVGTVDTADTGAPARDKPRAAGDNGAPGAAATAGDAGDGEARSAVPTPGTGASLSPAVRRVVEEHGLDASAIIGTGPGGRITKEDALKAAREQGPGGRASGAQKPAATPARAAEAPAAAGAAPSTGGAPGSTIERQRRVQLSTLRKRIAENLVRSRQQSAHVTTFNEVDMSEVMAIRARYRDSFAERHGVRLGFMSFFVKASQYALERSPEVNAYLDGSDIVYNDYVNIGVALSSEKGLLTPVLKDVATLGFADIEKAIGDFAERANARRIMPDELSGATFTISNGGVFGSLLSTPIPSPPQTAVLGMHTIQKRPVVVTDKTAGDQIVIRPMMYLALTYDHRMIDGREAVGFLGMIKDLIEDPARLLLGL